MSALALRVVALLTSLLWSLMSKKLMPAECFAVSHALQSFLIKLWWDRHRVTRDTDTEFQDSQIYTLNTECSMLSIATLEISMKQPSSLYLGKKITMILKRTITLAEAGQ